MGQRKETHIRPQQGIEAPLSWIIAIPGVAGGDPHIAGTRIPVWAIEDARRRGIADDAMLEMYPSIDREQLLAAHSYAELHVDEMNRLIAENADG